MTFSSWPEYFRGFFREIEGPLGIVGNANTCREMWLQGEFRWRADSFSDLKANVRYPNGRQFVDLIARQPNPMIAEIKVIGDKGYSLKMKYALNFDVERLRAFGDSAFERYMILVIPKYEKRDKLGEWLHEVSYADDPNYHEYDCPKFRARIWKV